MKKSLFIGQKVKDEGSKVLFVGGVCLWGMVFPMRNRK